MCRTLYSSVSIVEDFPNVGKSTSRDASNKKSQDASSKNHFALSSVAIGMGMYTKFYSHSYELSLQNGYTLAIFVALVSLAYKTMQLMGSSVTSSATTKAKLEDKQMAISNNDISSGGYQGASNVWTVHGTEYDLAEFVDRHPGGKEAILLGRGRDCTALFESYHPFTDQHRVVLQKYKIHRQEQKEKPTTSTTNEPEDEFYNIIKEAAAKKLQEHGIDPQLDRGASPSRVLHYLVIFTGLVIGAFYHIQGTLFGSFLFAVFGWLIGSLGHDGGHFAVSRTAWVNEWAVWGMSLLCNPIMWQHQHTYAHHSHTNDFENDPDIHHFDRLIRVHRSFKKNDIYKLQRHRPYVIFAYSFVVFGECMWIPWSVLKEGSLYGIVELSDKQRPVRALGMSLHLALYIGIIVIWPFFTGMSKSKAAAAVLIHIITSGLLFAVFSQINHLNEPSIEQNHKSKRKSLAKNSWAATQVETSNNFCTGSHVWHVLSNGLNLQIEHHLFPGLNHCHLPIIAPVVKQICEEYGVMYKCYDSWSDLMGATLEWLEKLSNAPDVLQEQ
mmetsp:Transcript_25649/g.36177  ORF Transcript_25649/g.36177 Transcript_25649/m.36177 type:complete len:553 (-) Transcript_25649:87-1745(-)